MKDGDKVVPCPIHGKNLIDFLKHKQISEEYYILRVRKTELSTECEIYTTNKTFTCISVVLQELKPYIMSNFIGERRVWRVSNRR